MTKISREEVLKIARASQIALKDDEVGPLIEQIEQVLTYAQRVKEVAVVKQETEIRNVNVFRQDEPMGSDCQAILERAPEQEGGYFVVPRILENS